MLRLTLSGRRRMSTRRWWNHLSTMLMFHRILWVSPFWSHVVCGAYDYFAHVSFTSLTEHTASFQFQWTCLLHRFILSRTYLSITCLSEQSDYRVRVKLNKFKRTSSWHVLQHVCFVFKTCLYTRCLGLRRHCSELINVAGSSPIRGTNSKRSKVGNDALWRTRVEMKTKR